MRCSCGGAWIAERLLAEMVALQRLPWRARHGVSRGCPMCMRPMQIVSLCGVVLDRCAPHGVWFDAFALRDLLTRMRRHTTPILGSRTGMPVADRRLLAALDDLGSGPIRG